MVLRLGMCEGSEAIGTRWVVQVCIFSMDRLERPRVSAPLPRISSPRPRASSPLGRSRTLRKVADRSNARPSKKFQLSGRFRRALILGPLLCIAAIYPLMWFLSVPPLSFARTTSSCLDEGTDYQISEHYLCTNACGKVCFPRVHGMCISRTQVTICDDLPYFSKDIIKAGGGLPDTLRLITNVPRDRVRVKRGTCPGWDSRLHEPVDASGSSSLTQPSRTPTLVLFCREFRLKDARITTLWCTFNRICLLYVSTILTLWVANLSRGYECACCCWRCNE